MTQEGCGISSSLVKNIEAGTAPLEGRGAKRATFMRALRWPPDALTRLAMGDDPTAFEESSEPAPDPPWDVLLDVMTEVRDEVRRLADRLEEGSP